MDSLIKLKNWFINPIKKDFKILKGDDKVKYIILIYLNCGLAVSLSGSIMSGWYCLFSLVPIITFTYFRRMLFNKYKNK